MSEERIEELQRRQEEIEKRFAEAFPAGDHVGHRRYHELMIEDIESKKRLRQAVVEKTVGGLVWAAVVGVGLAAWTWFKSHVVRF